MNSVLPAGIEAYLKEAGFSATEILVLKKLVEDESMTVRELAAKTGKSTGVLDQSMKKLLQKGVVQKGTINGQPRYSIRSLENLTSWVKSDMQQRKQVMDRKHQNFEQYISSLKMDRKRPDVEFFTGEEGVKQGYLKLLESGEELLSIMPILHNVEDDPLRAFKVDFFRKRKGKKTFKRVIAPDSKLARRFQSRDAFEYRRTVLVPENEFSLEFERTVSDGMVYCVNHAENNACLLRYPELAQVEKAAFNALWAKQLSSDKANPPTSLPAESIPLSTRMLSGFRETILSGRSVIAMILAGILCGVMAFGIYISNRQLNLEKIRETATGIVTVSASQFDAADIAAIQTSKDISKPQYARLVATLNLIRRSNPDIRFAYLMRKTDDPKTLEFVADADSLRPVERKDLNNDGILDASDALSYPGDPYDITEFPQVASAFEMPYSDAEPAEDQWGTFISAAAPIKDKEGKVVAIIGIDILATKLNEFAISSFRPIGVFLIFLLVYLGLRYFTMNISIARELYFLAKKNRVKLWIVGLAVVVTLAAITWISFFALNQLVTQEKGHRLTAIVSTAVDAFNEEDVDELRFANDMRKPEYQRVFDQLNLLRNKNPEIKYAYILRRVDKEKHLYEFVADADSNYNLPFYGKSVITDPAGSLESIEALAPGVSYIDTDTSKNNPLIKGFIKPSFSVITDEWGKLITACSVISDSSSDLLCIDSTYEQTSFLVSRSDIDNLLSEESAISHFIGSLLGRASKTWLLFAILAPFFFSIVHVLDEYCVEEVLEQPWMGVVTSAASSVVAYLALPALSIFIDWSSVSIGWIAVGLIAGVAIQCSQFFYFKALSYSEAGIVAAYWNLIPALLPIASFALFGQVLLGREYIGIAILIFSSTVMCLLDYHFETRNMTFMLMGIASCMQVAAYLLMGKLYHHHDFIISFYSVITGIIITGLLPLIIRRTRAQLLVAFKKIKPRMQFFVLIEIANILALGSAQMAIKLGDPSLVAAVETTVPAFTFLLSIPWLRHVNGSVHALWNNFPAKMAIVSLMVYGVWMLS